MATWTFRDGTILHSGGRVVGSTPFADQLRAAIADGLVNVFPSPHDGVALDRTSDFLLDVLATDLAKREKMSITTEYERDDDDAPAPLREELARRRELAHSAFFDTIH